MKCYIIILLLLCNSLLIAQDHKQDSLNGLIELAKKNNSWKTTIALIYAKGKLYYSEKDYEVAQLQFLQVDSIAKKYNHSDENTILAMVKRAEISKSTFSYDGVEAANTLLMQALVDAQKLDNEGLTYKVYRDLAYIKFLIDDTDTCRRYLDRIMPYFLANGDSGSISRIYAIYDMYYIKVDSLKKSEEYQLERIDYFRKHSDSIELAKSISSLGDFYRERLFQYKKALPYLNEAKVIYEKTNDTLIRPYLYLIENLAISHAETGDYQLGYEYYKKAYNLRKDIVRESNDVTTRRLEAKYQTKGKEQEIALLKSENEIVEQQKKNQLNLLLGGIAITSIAGLFMYFLYRNRQKTNNKLKELNELKSNFFANISHEFRTPLTLIASPIEDVLLDETLSTKKREQFTIAKQNTERLLELVNQLLDLSKIDSGHLKLHIQQGNVLQLISALSDSFSYYAEQKHINYTFNIEQNEEVVWFDKDAVEKITVNLLSNALKYTPENGTVSCLAYIENNKLFFEIKNSGKGLSEYELNNIFERFYQTNDQNQGTGIGLALVKELVDLCKGKIEVTSKQNRETIFKLYLAVDKKSFKNESIIAGPTIEIKKEIPLYANVSFEDNEEFTDSDLPILLIVEDNDDLRHLLKQIFENNYNIISASNGKIGVDEALEHIPDLIISDIMMPEKDGITLTKELKNDERTAHIPIILLTARAEVESQFKGIDTGADDYITKPFDKKLLTLKVEKIIETRRQLQLRYSQELVLIPKDLAITNLDEKFLKNVQSILDENLVESSFSVTKFSEAVGMSRMQLHRKLKALTGLTASEFVRSQRLKLAAQLLKTSDINISQVGYSVGFNDHSYFTKCFKDTYNCTPTEFAKRS